MGQSKMRLIADIGGTSSRWALAGTADAIGSQSIFPGFNPAGGDPSALQRELRSALLQRSAMAEAEEVIIYGAGCGHVERQERMRQALQPIWPQARITVHSDLLGAARGLYGDAAGLVLILGTGMNVGHYNGSTLHQPMPSLGYILGDEGSGADIGKCLVADAFHGRMPSAISKLLFPDGPDLAAIIESTYRSRAPQRFLASFTGMLADRSHDAYVKELLAARFRLLIRSILAHFAERERAMVRATGSVAFGFRSILARALAEDGMQLTEARPDPMPGLMSYHAHRP